MSGRLFHLVLFMALALSGSLAYGRGSPGPIPKKTRTLADYKPCTLKEIVALDSDCDAENRDKDRVRKQADLLPFRVSVIYTGSSRPMSEKSKDALFRWAQCCAGNPDQFTGPYDTEMRFDENGVAYWLAIRKKSLPDFDKELKQGEAVNLYLIRVAAGTDGNRDSVLLIERFTTAATINNQLRQETLDWIKRELPSNTKRDLRVEISGTCELKITDTLNNASISRASVRIPLTDLDSSKMSVARRQNSDAWELRLQTIAGKRSILFMLYQGGPAEGGQASEYSLTFPDQEKADAVAGAFRRVIELCAGKTSSW